MFKLLNKELFKGLLAVISLTTINVALSAQEFYPPTDCCPPSECCAPSDFCCPNECSNRFYIGAFGGQLFSTNRTKFTQTGVAFFPENGPLGGPLAIDARGHSKKYSEGFGGVQVGYEWRNCCQYCGWSISPAAELEAFFYRHNHHAHLINPTDRLEEHDFAAKFSSSVGVYLVNAVFSLNSCCLGNFTPYFGVGVGAANIRIKNAKSVQVSPPEVGVNHFDSDTSDTAWAFAAQAKAGVRYNFYQRFHIFAEYRFVYVDSSRYLFGSTIASGHVPTTTWNVDMKRVSYNAYAIGLQFDL